MQRLDDKLICGKLASYNFADAQRPELQPDGSYKLVESLSDMIYPRNVKY